MSYTSPASTSSPETYLYPLEITAAAYLTGADISFTFSTSTDSQQTYSFPETTTAYFTGTDSSLSYTSLSSTSSQEAFPFSGETTTAYSAGTDSSLSYTSLSSSSSQETSSSISETTTTDSIVVTDATASFVNGFASLEQTWATATTTSAYSIIAAPSFGAMQSEVLSSASETQTVSAVPPDAYSATTTTSGSSITAAPSLSAMQSEVLSSASEMQTVSAVLPPDAYMAPSVSIHDPMEAPMTTMESESSLDDPSTTTIYGVRIGASAPAQFSPSAIVFTTYSESTFTSESHVITTSFPVTSTSVTLLPMTTGSPTSLPLSSPSSPRRNTALIVGVTVPLVVLLIAAIVAIFAFRRRQRQRPGSDSESFFPVRRGSARSSLVAGSEKRLTAETSVSLSRSTDTDRDSLDRLRLAIPQLQIPSSLSPGAALRDTLTVVPTTTLEPGDAIASCQASIIGVDPQSPTSSRWSTAAARQEQLLSEMDMAWEEINVLEKRGSPQRFGATFPGGEVGVAERRIEALHMRIQELEREQVALRLEVEMTMDSVYPPPDYVTTEG
ncbi:hypothetical protein C8R45DRAFT_60822 [Mycena sanguinolenta]|nr:hypothetical protein C8R45DRAFT_60822 [Mycena sanguinolenta]